MHPHSCKYFFFGGGGAGGGTVNPILGIPSKLCTKLLPTFNCEHISSMIHTMLYLPKMPLPPHPPKKKCPFPPPPPPPPITLQLLSLSKVCTNFSLVLPICILYSPWLFMFIKLLKLFHFTVKLKFLHISPTYLLLFTEISSNWVKFPLRIVYDQELYNLTKAVKPYIKGTV